jgi:biofilm PGA synthesis protein PgaA
MRLDRIYALRNRERWAEVEKETAALRADGVQIPSFVREAEADSLLALRRPCEARHAYEDVLHSDPKHREAHIGRFFALVEEEKFADAFHEIDQLAASEKPGTHQPKQRLTYENEKSLEGKILAAQGRYFGAMPMEAWKMLLPLASHAPANAELRTVLGDFADSCGWPRRSAEEIEIAASLAPQEKDTQIALAESAIRRRSWAEARARLATLLEIYPTDANVLRVQRSLKEHDRFELQSELHLHHEYGVPPAATTASTAPGDEILWTTRLYTPAIAEYWRGIAAWDYGVAKVPEGIGRRYREGGGAQLALPDLTLEALGWANQGDINRGGASASVTWEPTDNWRFDGGAEYFTGDTPLRAVLNDIYANMASFGVTYQWHEGQSLSLGVKGYEFTDGNRRVAVDLNFEKKIIEIPHFDLKLKPELYTSGDKLTDVPYYSPKRDLSGSLTVDAEQILWRRYERSFGHRLALTGGGYWEESFGTGWIGTLLYEQVYKYDPWVEFRYGVQWNRAIYDGVPTPSVEIIVHLNLRF